MPFQFRHTLLIPIALLIFSCNSLADGYRLGEGYSVGSLNVAGYINMVMQRPEGEPTSLVGDDLSLFISGHYHRYLNPFIEVEFTEAEIWREGERPLSGTHPEFVVERLYNDSYLTDNLSLRIGKMLTPVGEWNTVHAAPLVLTSTRPLTTHRSFPEYTSGAAIDYVAPEGLWPESIFYWQPEGELFPHSNDRFTRKYRHQFGLHLNWDIAFTDKIGVSLQHADIDGSDVSQTLMGFNIHKTFGKLQVESEATYTNVENTDSRHVNGHEWGAYMQGNYALADRWTLVARHEHFQDRHQEASSRNNLIGLCWHPVPAIAWKLEYVEQNGAELDIHTGLFASFSVLF